VLKNTEEFMANQDNSFDEFAVQSAHNHGKRVAALQNVGMNPPMAFFLLSTSASMNI
jgi:hypothetical protein